MKKHVYFVNSSPILGGHENMMLNIISILKNEYEVHIIFNKKNGFLKKKIQQLKFENSHQVTFLKDERLSFKLINSLLDLITYFFYIKKNISKESTIIFNDGGLYASLPFQIAALYLGRKSILYIPLGPTNNMSEIKWRRIFTTYFLKKFHAIVAINTSILKHIKQSFGLSNTKLIENFLLNQDFRLKKPLGELEPIHEIKILFLGRIHFEHKGIDLFLKNIFPSLDDNIKIHFVGAGPDKQELIKNIETYKSTNRLEVIDWTNQIDVLFCNYDLLMLCSHYEGDSLAIMEAVNANLNVVSTDTGTFLEYFPSSQMFSLDSPQSFIAAIHSALANSNDEHFWQKLFDLQKTNRDPESVKKKWMEII